MSLRVRLLTLFLLLLFLNHHVESGSIVKFLPGFEGPLPFVLETGYIGVGEEEQVQLFYYFIKSERNPKEDPLLLWLDGGPGCSAIYGLFLENGPLALKFEVYNGSVPSLVSTTYSWTKMASILYLEQPVGTGFSYSKSSLIDNPSDSGEARRIHEFVQKWLSKNPEFYSNPFYVGGTSYSGMIVPALVQEISNGNYICCKPLINLQGYILGNPVTHIDIEQNYRIPFAHGMALIPDELYEKMKRICKGNYLNVDPLNIECGKLKKTYESLTDGIHPNYILIPYCDKSSPDCFLYRYFLLDRWANKDIVREALHVNKENVVEWVRCNGTIGTVYNFDITNSVPYHLNNSLAGYRSLIFSGDHDMAVPFLATQAWIRSLNYSISDDWRPWMINNLTVGYTRSYANKMTFATVKGGGHTPEYKPNESYVMFQRWISHKPL